MKKFGVTIAELSALVILYGLTKEILYYNYYGVSIKSFVGLTEIGILISEELLLIVPVTALYIGFWMFAKLNAEEETLKKPQKFTMPPFAYSYMLIAFTLNSIYFFYKLSLFLYHELFVAYIIVAGVLILFLLSEKHLKSFIQTKEAYFLVVVLLVTAGLLIYMTGYEIKKTNQGRYTGTTVITPQKTYFSTDTSYYIGKTEKFVFFYNSNENITDIIPVDQITEFKLKTLSNNEIRRMRNSKRPEIKQSRQ